VKHSGFWIRAVAYTIDLFILGIVLSVIIAALGWLSFQSLVSSGGGTVVVQGLSALMGLLEIVVVIGYFTLMEGGRKQGTFGKQITGIRVVDLEGAPITRRKAFIRTLGKLVSALLLGIGYLMVPFTEKKQGLHDLVAATLVVETPRDGESGGAGGGA